MFMQELTKELLKKGERFDGRKFDEIRDMKIETSVIHKAEGSARVTLGKSMVIAGVKLGIGKPFADSPDEGVLMVNAELVPMASPDFEPGPPREGSIELARVVDRGIRESGTIDNKKLCITEGEEVWMVNIDIDVLDHDGNLIDCAAAAAIAAILDTEMPEYKDGKIDITKKKGKLPIKEVPVAMTFGKAEGVVLADPTADEEKAMEARLTVTFADGDICAFQKGGTGTLDKEDVFKMIGIAEKRSKEIRKLLRK